MRIGVCWPTVRPLIAIDTVRAWQSLGFTPLLMTNREVATQKFKDVCGVIVKDAFDGYYREQNLLCSILFKEARCDMVVCASDYIYPDPNLNAAACGALFATKFPNGTGVLQSVYEKFEGSEGNCWSPWVGRNFWQEFYGGEGPFHFGYFQYAGGRELHDIAVKERVYLETDVAHQHRRMPEKADYYTTHNRSAYWDQDHAVYSERKHDGFPGASTKSQLFLPPKVGRIILPSEL